jgi:hypothetical protein
MFQDLILTTPTHVAHVFCGSLANSGLTAQIFPQTPRLDSRLDGASQLCSLRVLPGVAESTLAWCNSI